MRPVLGIFHCFWLRGRRLDAAPPCQRLTPQLSFMQHKLANCRQHRLVPLHQEEMISFKNSTERQECTNHQKGEIDSNSCSLQQAAQHAGLVYWFFRCISDPTVSLVGSRKVFAGLIENDLLAYVWDVLVLDLKDLDMSLISLSKSTEFHRIVLDSADLQTQIQVLHFFLSCLHDVPC